MPITRTRLSIKSNSVSRIKYSHHAVSLPYGSNALCVAFTDWSGRVAGVDFDAHSQPPRQSHRKYHERKFRRRMSFLVIITRSPCHTAATRWLAS